MRKKLREIMDKEEGFTLVELLAVIVILGIIVAIAIPSIGNVIENSRTKANKAEIELVEDAARLYITVEKDGKVSEDDKSIPVATLIEKGYLEVDKGKLTGNVIVTVNDKTITYDASNVKRTATGGSN